MITMRTQAVVFSGWLMAAAISPVPAQTADKKADAVPPSCPIGRIYEGYKPDFVDKPLHEGGGRGPSKELMDLSSEQKFFSLNLLPESDRAYALAKAALDRAAEGAFGEALDIFHRIIEEYPNEMYRASGYGVFVPMTQFAQLRMLSFPRSSLAHYRAKHDARAREAFELARQSHSLEGMAHVRDTMLATSYGAPAMILLGDAALDRGHFLEALEYYTAVRDHFPDPDARTPELRLKIAYCRRMLGDANDKETRTPTGPDADSRLRPEDLKAFERYLAAAKPAVPALFEQRSSPPYVTADDYASMPPTSDPLGLTEPQWTQPLPGAIRGSLDWDAYVYSNPLITQNSVIYRHKNIVYCRSILNGQLRWINDMGGRVTWQNWHERQYTHEDVLAQDGLVFTPMHQVGPTLVALDEITGQMRWAYGPMVATTAEEANMRFEAAPAGGPMTVYAGYILDNIEGMTHTDTEYGMIAFDSATGRVRWRRSLGRLRPGRFVAGHSRRRNRIRSFASPPLYHQGTVYHTTNAGTIAALDALSGQIKWIMRHPYWYHPHAVHDATRHFGDGGEFTRYTRMLLSPHNPMFWYPQRPMMIGDDLYVMPVNSKFMYKLCRRTGKVHWTSAPGGARYFMGPLPSGELLVASSGGAVQASYGLNYHGHSPRLRNKPDHKSEIMLLDPDTGRAVTRLNDPVGRQTLTHVTSGYGLGGTSYPVNFSCLGHDNKHYMINARPFLSRNGQLIVGGLTYWGYGTYGYAVNFGLFDLNVKDRPVVQRRHYFSPQVIAQAENAISQSEIWMGHLEKLPHKDENVLSQIATIRKIITEEPPENEHPQFMSFQRTTFERYGTVFELRLSPRSVAMVYDAATVDRALKDRSNPESLFGRAEVAIRNGRLSDAAKLMEQCLAVLPSEATDFRTLINQQLYQTHLELARGGVRAGCADTEMTHCLGMNRTATTLGNELEVRFAVADAFERKGEPLKASLQLQSVVSTYAHYGYPLSSLQGADRKLLSDAASAILAHSDSFASGIAFSSVLAASSSSARQGVPLYFSALSPLEKDLTVRAGVWAATRLNRLRQSSESFANAFEIAAQQALAKVSDEEQLARIPEFPGTQAAQTALDKLLTDSASQLGRDGIGAEAAAALRRRQWHLADMAHTGSLTIPSAIAPALLAPAAAPTRTALSFPAASHTASFEEERSPVWLTLERQGRHDIEPDLLFLGGRVRTRFDNKFLLYAVDARSGKTRWRATEVRGETRFDELRLEGLGDEPGFFEAFVHGDTVVTHGLYDVLAFRLKDGTLKWRYRVPFAFEIQYAKQSGNLLVLAGPSETVALYLGTDDPRGEVAWQTREEGALYGAPYLHGDRWVSVRRQPFNLTTRSRATGRLLGRLALPDLTLHTQHPLVENGPQSLPLTRDGARLLITDGWYYIMLDVEQMRIVWKRLIDNNDMTSEPPFRFAMGDGFLAVLKKDFDVNAIYMLSADTGNVLWRTDPKDSQTPRPIHSMAIRDGKLYGIRPHAGQGFYFVGLDCATGKDLFRPNEQTGYGSRPAVRLRPAVHGNAMVAEIQDRQDFELKAFHIADGKLLHSMRGKGSGEFGEHGRASATVQNDAMALMAGHSLALAAPQK